MNRAEAFARYSEVPSTGASRIRSKPPCSRSATKTRLIARMAANNTVASKTPAAREPERLSRSSPNRKSTNVVAENSSIAGTDSSVRSSTRRSLARIAR